MSSPTCDGSCPGFWKAGLQVHGPHFGGVYGEAIVGTACSPHHPIIGLFAGKAIAVKIHCGDKSLYLYSKSWFGLHISWNYLVSKTCNVSWDVPACHWGAVSILRKGRGMRTGGTFINFICSGTLLGHPLHGAGHTGPG